MKNKIFTDFFVGAGCFLSVGMSSTGCKGNRKTDGIPFTKKPNIIFILADDLGYGDLSCYGQTHFQTPNIDRLASEGMRFTQFYAGSTVSAPSRSALMTGQHTGHTYIRGNREAKPEGQFPLLSSAITLAEILKEAGYVTGAFGKWGLGYPGSEGDPNNQGFDEFYGYNCQRIAHNYYPYHMWNNQVKEMLPGNSGNLTGTYGPDTIHRKALDFIERNRDTSFFLYYPSVIPHAELIAPETCMAMFRGKYLPEKKFEGIDEGERFRNGGYGSQDEPHAAFAAMIYLLDKQVGEIMAKINEMGITEKTIIFFSSDNGPHKEGGGDPDYFEGKGNLRGYKRDLYEGGIRVPLIACWPGKINPGSISRHAGAFWDFLPTLCEIIRINTPGNTDGISFLPELTGKRQKRHDYLYWEFHEQGGKQAVRSGRWKGIRLNMDKNPDAPIELYNLTDDPAEQNNLAVEYPEKVKEIENIMKKEHSLSKEFSYTYEKTNPL